MLLDYGQPLNGIVQFAYVVEDIQQAMRTSYAVHGVGPWFVTVPFSPRESLYRGQRTDFSISLARAFSGSIMLELIQQHDTHPSPYREIVERKGYGFHHFAIMSDRFDADIERYRRSGYEMAFYDVLQGGRIAYFDTSHEMPGMTELIELTPTAEARHTLIQRASVGWDGQDPIRQIALA